jgi:NADP-dependent 3-hydroxy-3-methylglutaryl-CoA reductase
MSSISAERLEKQEALQTFTEIFRQSYARAPKEIDRVRIENCIGHCQVPLGMAGPLRIVGPDFRDDVCAPMATYEPTLIASCSRGCKAFNAAGGIRFEIFENGMSRAPVFQFDETEHAIWFAKAVPGFRDDFAQWASETSTHVQLKKFKASVIGSQVHLFCSYDCGSATGQNMVTKATQYACDMLRAAYEDQFLIRDFFIEGQLASDKKPSWGNVKSARGVEVVAWGTITKKACQEVLGLSTERLYHGQTTLKEGGIRNGQFGSNINTANVIAAMFISTGQDPASVAESSWTHLTSELDRDTGDLRMSLYIPSLAVGTVGGGTGYPSQQEALRLLKCGSAGQKNRLAGTIASFSLALDVSTSAAISNDTFTASHMKLARGEVAARL